MAELRPAGLPAMPSPTYELLAAPGAGSMIVEAMLELCGVPYRVTDAVPWETGPHLDRLRALNPLCQVPTLILLDGTVMTESAAIALHLCDLYPQAGLAPPPGDPARAAFLRWLAFLVANVYATFTLGDDPSRWVSDENAQRELRARTDAHRQQLWRIVESRIDPAPWFLGTRFSVLDLYVLTMTLWRPRRSWFAAECPKLHAIALAAEALPRLSGVVARNPM